MFLNTFTLDMCYGPPGFDARNPNSNKSKIEEISTYFATAKDVRIPMFLNKPQFVHELKESVTKYVEPNSRVSLVNPQFLVDDPCCLINH